MRQPIDIEAVLASDPGRESVLGQTIGHSRLGRPIEAFVLGDGPIRISLIGGCHADEPVGPAMLKKLVTYLESLPKTDPLVAGRSWRIVPHVNPDGAAVNAAWSDLTQPVPDHRNVPDEAYDLVTYAQEVVRELPGDDIEFGFPRNDTDLDARPENRAVAAFLRPDSPVHLHASFHGMGLAPGPWFLLEPTWISRTTKMRQVLRDTVQSMGYRPMDLDRRGEKGFSRIDEGFSTRPDSGAMAAHFEALGDHETASKFRPSSMEYVRGLGGDPLSLVSEMPLFLVPEDSGSHEGPRFEKGTEGRKRLLAWLEDLISGKSSQAARQAIAQVGILPMPIRDQMRLQLAFLGQALALITVE
jgi:hypothetical protein